MMVVLALAFRRAYWRLTVSGIGAAIALLALASHGKQLGDQGRRRCPKPTWCPLVGPGGGCTSRPRGRER